MDRVDKIVIIVPPRSIYNGEIELPVFVPNDNLVSSFTPDPFSCFANYFDNYSGIPNLTDTFEPREVLASLDDEYSSLTSMGIEILEMQETDIELSDDDVLLQPREFDIELD